MSNKTVRLSDIAEVKSGKRLPKDEAFADNKDGVPYISISDMGDVFVSKNKIKYISKDTEALIRKYKVETNDIIVSIAGSLGKINLIDLSLNNANLTENCNKVTVKGADYLYVYHYLKSEIFQNQIDKLATKSGQPKLGLDRLRDCKIVLPVSTYMQTQIGSFLTTQDDRIAAQQELISLLEQQKQGYQQQIFSRKLAFKDDNGNPYPEWEEVALNDVFTKYSEIIWIDDAREYKQVSISNKGEVKLRKVTLGEKIGRKRQFLINTVDYPNTLCFTRQTIFEGGIGFVPKNLNGAIVTENMPLLSLSTSYSREFVDQLLKTYYYYSNVIQPEKPIGSAQLALHEKIWLKQKMELPSLPEQKKIASLLLSMDDRIHAEKEKLELLKEQKKGYMQKIFA